MDAPTHPPYGAGQQFVFDRSGSHYPTTELRWRGDDGGPLMPGPQPSLAAADIVGSVRSLWRYQAAIPVPVEHRVSLGEGCTPLLALPWHGALVHFKLEWVNPTGSFKDRGASVLLSHLVSLGVTQVLEDSSGNGGCALAAYSAAAGVQATILAPSSASEAKLRQARAYGAEVELVDGTRDDVADEAVRRSGRTTYASHNWHPFFLQGTKTLGYELWEGLGFRAPDNVVLVAGAGSMVLGCDLAFTQLFATRQIDRLPRLLVGQPEHWATIADTLNGVGPTLRGPRTPTIAEGAAVARPVRLAEAVAAVRRSEGAAVAVTDTEVADAARRLARRGLYVEPTSAVAVAALDRFLADGTIGSGQTTVVVLTGSGLKSAAVTEVVDQRAGTGTKGTRSPVA
jgi:threonine synthase